MPTIVNKGYVWDVWDQPTPPAVGFLDGVSPLVVQTPTVTDTPIGHLVENDQSFVLATGDTTPRRLCDYLQQVIEFETLVTPEMFGARADDSTFDNSTAIQAAIDTGKAVYFGTGTYWLALSQTLPIIGWSASPCALVAKTGMVLIGAGQGKTILKLRTGATVNSNWNLMSSNLILDDIVIRDMTFDLNGANNSVAGNSLMPNTAALMVSGNAATAGVEACCNRARITNIGVINTPGANCLVFGQSVIGPMGYDNVVQGCYFYNSGLSWTDHSSIFLRCDRSVVRDCYFSNPAAQTGLVGAAVCVECHGSGNSIVNNTCNNYMQFSWISGLPAGFASPQIGSIITGNKIEVNAIGIAHYNGAGGQIGGLLDVIIANNVIKITADTPTHGGYAGSYRHAIGLNTNDTNVGSLKRVQVLNNICECLDTVYNFGIILTSTNNQVIIDTTISGNVFDGFSLGIYCQPDGSNPGSLVNTVIRNNTIKNLVPTTAVPAQTAGITVTGGTFDYTIQGNIVPISTNNAYYGINLTGSISDLQMDGNRLAASNTMIRDAITVTNKRTGQQARTFAALPAQSQWLIGDVAFNSALVEAGAAAAKYVITGWNRITNGSGNVLNTDWLQNRALTGN